VAFSGEGQPRIDPERKSAAENASAYQERNRITLNRGFALNIRLAASQSTAWRDRFPTVAP
jgi:hypothetical protein